MHSSNPILHSILLVWLSGVAVRNQEGGNVATSAESFLKVLKAERGLGVWLALAKRKAVAGTSAAVSGAPVASQGEDDSTPRPCRQRRVYSKAPGLLAG